MKWFEFGAVSTFLGLTRDVDGAVLDVRFAGGLDAAAQSARVTPQRSVLVVVRGSLEFLPKTNNFWDS